MLSGITNELTMDTNIAIVDTVNKSYRAMEGECLSFLCTIVHVSIFSSIFLYFFCKNMLQCLCLVPEAIITYLLVLIIGYGHSFH